MVLGWTARRFCCCLVEDFFYFLLAAGWGLVGLDVRGTSADFLEYYRSEFEW